VLPFSFPSFFDLLTRLLCPGQPPPSSPFYYCGTGPGSPYLYGVSVYSLAAATLAVFGILYPVVTFLTLWSISRRSRGVACGEFGKEHDSRIWEELVEDEFTRDRWCV